VEVFKFAVEKKLLTAEKYAGDWCDVGTVERLTQLDKSLSL
jgi:NDP-sugar pyrophosphorylase family protein